jgi:hypothetical protein
MSEAARGFENFILVGMQNLQNDDHERKVAGNLLRSSHAVKVPDRTISPMERRTHASPADSEERGPRLHGGIHCAERRATHCIVQTITTNISLTGALSNTFGAQPTPPHYDQRVVKLSASRPPESLSAKSF